MKVTYYDYRITYSNRHNSQVSKEIRQVMISARSLRFPYRFLQFKKDFGIIKAQYLIRSWIFSVTILYYSSLFWSILSCYTCQLNFPLHNNTSGSPQFMFVSVPFIRCVKITLCCEMGRDPVCHYEVIYTLTALLIPGVFLFLVMATLSA